MGFIARFQIWSTGQIRHLLLLHTKPSLKLNLAEMSVACFLPTNEKECALMLLSTNFIQPIQVIPSHRLQPTY